MQSTTLLIIGGGPGGYVAAIRAGQLGIPTVLVETGSVGGTCLNIGCIPSKALIHAAEQFHAVSGHVQHSSLGISVKGAASIDIAKTVLWKDGIVKRLTGGVAALLKKNHVQVIKGWAHIVDGKHVDVLLSEDGQAPSQDDQDASGEEDASDAVATRRKGKALRISCEHLLLATGSTPVALPFMPFGGKVISSTEALSPKALPKHLAVVGGGYIGLELGMAYRKLGVAVSIVESQARILPAYDAELARPVADALVKLGIDLHLSCSVEGLENGQGDLLLKDAEGGQKKLAADQVLVAVGRRPRTEGFGLESLDLGMNGRAVSIDDQCRTSMRDVWAIGDVTGEPMLAHRAMAQGEMVAEIIAGQRRHFVPASIPAVCFTDPEVVVAGLDPEQAGKQGLDCISAIFPFAANGRAMTLESSAGFVRVVARQDNHQIVGWQAVGRGVSELVSGFSQSLEMGARLEDIAGTVHAHPSLGEAVQEAALRALGQALHI